MVEEMVEEAVHTIETIVVNTWVTWVGQLVLNITCRVREVDARDCKEKERKIHEEAEAKERLVCKEKERKICKEAEAKERLVCKEAERVVREEAERATQRERCQQEKLDLFLNKSITAEEFEKDLEAEAEAERSKVMGEGMVKDAFGMQMSEMEVDDTGEDEVGVEDKGTKGGRKWAPSSPPKLLGK